MISSFFLASVLFQAQPVEPVRTEVITPIRNATFNKGGKAKKRVQGGNPRQVNGLLVFDGSQDGGRQVDPQIAVGGGFIFHGSNSGFVIYDKKGNYVDGVPQSEFNNGIDPKVLYDVTNKVFCFDLWYYYDGPKLKPVNVSVSETSDPRGAWNTYPVPAQNGVDGGAIGCSRRWIGYSFPGGPEQTFVLSMADAKAGKPTTIYHFAGSLGHPVLNQDSRDELFFVKLSDQNITITTVGAGPKGTPVIKNVATAPHGFRRFGWPPASPMKGTEAKTASGDRNPKNLVLQSNHLWFSQAVNVDGRAGVQWHQVRLDGTFVQSGLISHPTNSYIETTIGVNKKNDVVVGFQETGPDMFISPRVTWRRSGDRAGTVRSILSLGEGVAATEGGAWGDYSGCCVDGDNMKDIWTIQSVANAQGRGSTVIAKVSF